jgi:ubiquitin-conjugating enzyme E2 M
MLALKRKREAQRAAAASGAPLMGLENVGTSPGGSKPGKKKRTPAELRIQKDLSMVEQDEAVTISFPNLDDLTDFRLTVAPRRGPWKGGEFEFVLCVQQSYPYFPPRVTCETKIYHPNVSFYDGGVCLGLRDWWRPVHDISTVIHGLVNMFYEPEVDIAVNQQAADLLNENHEQFLRVVNWTRRMTNDSKPMKDQYGHCILDVLPREMVRTATDFLDEESLVKFFIAALGSVPHQYIYTSMARRIVQERFALLHELVSNPLPVVPPARVPPVVPPAVIEFVVRYVSHIDQPEAPNRVPVEPPIATDGISARADEISARAEAFERARLEDNESGGDQGIVQTILWLAGHMAVLYYFRDTIASNTRQDILWPVWCGKLQLNVSKEQELKAPSSMIATPIWYPSLIRRCKHAFANEYHARTMLHGFDVMRRFERGFNFVLATVTGISAKDCEELRLVDGRRLNRFGGEGANAFYRMAVVPPIRAREMLHRLATLRAGAATNRVENADLPIAQYERIVGAEGEGSSQLFCLWEDGERDVATAHISCQEFANEVVEFLTTRKSIQLLSNLPEYWQANEWAEPPTLMWRRS